MNSAIIVAAGRGDRMNAPVSKQYLEIGGRAILYWTLRAFLDHPGIEEIIMIIRKEDEALYKTCVEKYIDKKKPIKIAFGGQERKDSVLSGLGRVDQKAENILIHDGVRPFVREEDISDVLTGLESFVACVTGVYVKDTIKILSPDGIIQDTPDRSKVFAVHTPQGFRKKELLKAYQSFYRNYNDLPLTDDSFIMEKTGYEVKAIVGSYENIKITTSEDMLLAEGILAERLKSNV